MIRLATSLAVTRRKESSESSEGLMYSANPFSLGPIIREGTGNIRGEERESQRMGPMGGKGRARFCQDLSLEAFETTVEYTKQEGMR